MKKIKSLNFNKSFIEYFNKNKYILLTGGLGFIGFNLALLLNSIGFNNLIIVDNIFNDSYNFINQIKLKRLSRINFINYFQKEKFLELIKDQKLLSKYELNRIGFIFHQGACTNTLEQDLYYLLQNNFEYSKEIFNFSKDFNIPLIYASSASVYGNLKNPKKIEYNPLNYYALSKFLFDNYVINSLDDFRNVVIGLRYFNVYGFYEEHKGFMASVIFHFFNQALKENIIKVFQGSQNFYRDFIFVDDIVYINLFLFKIIMQNNNLDDLKEINGVYDCGTSKPVSFMYIANIVKDYIQQKLNKKNINILEIPFPDELKNKYQFFTKANNKKLIQVFKKYNINFKFTSIYKGVKKYLDYLLKNFKN